MNFYFLVALILSLMKFMEEPKAKTLSHLLKKSFPWFVVKKAGRELCSTKVRIQSWKTQFWQPQDLIPMLEENHQWTKINCGVTTMTY